MHNSPILEHEPVLVDEILEKLPPDLSRHASSNKNNTWMLDATFGRGGHTKAILQYLPTIRIIGLDRDKSAVEWGLRNQSLFQDQLTLLHGNFYELPKLIEKDFPCFLKTKGFDIIIMDLGVSSPQLDRSERGFSFYQEGPLDMRMDQTQHFSAYDIINTWNATELRDLFYSYGEIHHCRKVVQAILKKRKKEALSSTKQLANLIEQQIGWKKKGTHPATPYFLSLRLKVNEELESLRIALPKMIDSLKTNGRLFVLSFHSLEDRIVKYLFREKHRVKGTHLTKKVIQSSREEIKKNHRARSARLRIFEKG